jgi:hypothetical protein
MSKRKSTSSAMDVIFKEPNKVNDQKTTSQPVTSDLITEKQQNESGIGISRLRPDNQDETNDKHRVYNEKTTAVRIKRTTLGKIDELLEDMDISKKELAEVLLNGIIDYPKSCLVILNNKLGKEKAEKIIDKALSMKG